MFHCDIWEDWNRLAKENPGSKRALILRKIDTDLGGYDNMVHIFLSVVPDQNGDLIIEFYGRWNSLKNLLLDKIRPGECSELRLHEKRMLVRQMQRYGLNVSNIRPKAELPSAAEISLRDMMKPFVLRNKQKLKRVITDRKLLEYERLATHFLTNPDAKKSGPLYNRYLEYEEILRKL